MRTSPVRWPTPGWSLTRGPRGKRRVAFADRLVDEHDDLGV
jgi:hypothetical protein